jgi:hypothetical protein
MSEKERLHEILGSHVVCVVLKKQDPPTGRPVEPDGCRAEPAVGGPKLSLTGGIMPQCGVVTQETMMPWAANRLVGRGLDVG